MFLKLSLVCIQIDYNLHVAYARLGKVDLEKNHLDTASDIMFRIILKAERGALLINLFNCFDLL